MKYTFVCDVQDSSEIYLDSSGFVSCGSGSLQIIQYSPTLSEMSLTEVNTFLSPIVTLIFISWTLGLLIWFIKNKII